MARQSAKPCKRTRIKLCGVTSIEEVDAAIEAGVDALGLVFSSSAERCVLPHTAMQIAKRIPPFVSVVGVFSNPSDPDLMAWPGRWVQLMGDENEPQLQRVARLRSIIKGFPWDAAQLRRWDRCAAVNAMLVLVPPTEQGNGAAKNAIDELAQAANGLHTPIIIGGALTPENVGAWVKAVGPHGVDIGLHADGSAASVRDVVAAVRATDGA